MKSLRATNAARAVGPRSRGPQATRTATAKAISPTNAIEHGLLGQCVVLRNESDQGFREMLAQHVDRFQPADGIELAWVEEMATAQWRMRRAWAIEGRLMDEALSHQPAGDEASRIASAYTELVDSQRLDPLYRYETHLQRLYQRALQNIVAIGKGLSLNESGLLNEIPAEGPIKPLRRTLPLELKLL